MYQALVDLDTNLVSARSASRRVPRTLSSMQHLRPSTDRPM